MLEELVSILSKNPEFHQVNTEIYQCLSGLADENRKIYKKDYKGKLFGKIFEIPYVEMGNINSSDLFIIHELCLFSIYKKKSNIYPKFIDIGANIGIHSIIAHILGYEVSAYEPDPKIFNILKNVVKNYKKIKIVNKAVASNSAKRQFTRVNDNLTASGLSDSGKNYYGNIENFDVQTIGVGQLNLSNSIVKVDAEGSEVEIIKSIDFNQIHNALFLIEISNDKNKSIIWKLSKRKGLELKSQKLGWKRATNIDDLPNTWREGSISICLP